MTNHPVHQTREIEVPPRAGHGARGSQTALQMPGRVAQTDWQETPLGDREGWPQSLITAVDLCLGSASPTAVCWGPELTLLYNDAFAAVLGDRHPWALGRPYHDVFLELSHVFEPLIEEALGAGAAVGCEGQMLPVDRNGYLEDAYFAFNLTPIADESDGIAGVFVTAAETTPLVLGDRRMRTLQELAQLGYARDGVDGDGVDVVAGRLRDVLAAHAADIPFSLIYMVDDVASPTRLQLVPGNRAKRRSSLKLGKAFSPPVIDLGTPDASLLWPVDRVMKNGRPEVVRGLSDRMTTAIGDEDLVHTAVVQPLVRPGDVNPFGVLVMGTSPRRALDPGYFDFLELVANQVGHALAATLSAPPGAESAAGRSDRPDRGSVRGRGFDDSTAGVIPAQEAEGRSHTPSLALMLEATEKALAAPSTNRRAEIYDLFCQVPAPFCVLRGPNLVFETANPAYIRLFGRPDMVGKPLVDALPEVRGQGLEQLLLGVMRSGVPHIRQEIRSFGPAKDQTRNEVDEAFDDATSEVSDDVSHEGTPNNASRHPATGDEERFWTLIYSPLRALDGAIDRVMVFAWEVTEQVQARGELERARQQAEEASLAKDQFLAMLGHELRNPLSPILTAIQLMHLRGMRSREQEVIERQVGHLVRLVDDLLDIARITRGKVELRREPLQLAGIVVQGIEQASPLLEQRHQRLVVNVAPTGLLVSADADRLAQVVSNLLTNAAKYSDPGSRIHVSAERVGDKAILSVRDEGLGIAPDMLDTIFDSFVQHRQPLDRASGGLGLGLAIVRTLVRLHGGTVVAHSDGPGTGSEFRVELPLSDGVHIAETTAESDRIYLHETYDAKGAEHVLVVDDNQDGAEILAEVLRELGHTVEIAHDGPTALAIAERFKPQLALLDIGLPVMDGYELARHLREKFKPEDLRLVAVTGYGQETDRKKTAAAGFSAHIVKPVDLDVLTTVVRHH
jgi:signal transduction histidine kinase/CheY-like chemotaxis protein